MNFPIKPTARSTNSSGKKIIFTPNAEKAASMLRRAARQGYFYPMLALKQLDALASGLAGKNNVYIPNINTAQANTFQLFHVYVPGIRATVERRSDDSYRVTQLEISEGYTQIGKKDQKPGIYEVEKQGDDFVAKYKNNGRIKPQDGRVAVIAGPSYSSMTVAVEDVHEKLAKTPGRSAAETSSFDLLFSPLGESLGRAYNPAGITAGYAFAGLLAKAMQYAKSSRNVIWVSQDSGSVILTQAMEILARQHVTLPTHLAHLYKPTSSPSQAVRLAHKLEMNPGNHFITGSSSVRVALGNLHAKALRVRNDDDPYSLKDYGSDLATISMGGVALGSAAAFGGSLLPVAPAVAGVIASAGAITSGLGATHLLWTHGKNLLENRKLK